VIQELRQSSPVDSFDVYRRTGVEAFTDLSTAMEVDKNAGLAADVMSNIRCGFARPSQARLGRRTACGFARPRSRRDARGLRHPAADGDAERGVWRRLPARGAAHGHQHR
jgi:hypothetical protein